VASIVRLGHLLVAAAGGGVHALPLLAQGLGDVRELHAGVAGVDLGAGDLHEAHVRTLGALGLVGVDDILALAAAALLLAILANLALLGLLALGLACCWKGKKMSRGDRRTTGADDVGDGSVRKE